MVRRLVEFDSDHYQSARRIFGDEVYTGRDPKFAEGLAIVAFTNRCGSNLLADYLFQSGSFGRFSELLNHDVMPQKAREFGATNFPDYIIGLEQNLRRPGRPLCLKASCTQLAMLHRYGALEMFPWTKVIHVHRDDLVAQAVSFHIAARTNQWTSRQERSDVPLRYDFADIRNRFNGLANDNRRILQICSALALDVVSVRYEDLVARPRDEIVRILDFFGMTLGANVVLDPTIERQAGTVNEQFARRFRRDWLRSEGIEPPSAARAT